MFFEEHIPYIAEVIDQQRFHISKEDWEEYQRAMEEYYSERTLSDT